MTHFFRPSTRAERDLKATFGKPVATSGDTVAPNEVTAAYMVLREMQSRLDSGFAVDQVAADPHIEAVKTHIGQANDYQLDAWLDHDHCGGTLMLAIRPAIVDEAVRRGLRKPDPVTSAYFPTLPR